MSRNSAIIWQAVCGLALALAFAVLVPGSALAQDGDCGDDARAAFNEMVAAGASDQELEDAFGHCRDEVVEPTCPVVVKRFGARRGLASVDQKIKVVTNQNISYERMNGCGYHPQSEVVACDVEIRQFGGYGGFPWGTFERVRFCLDCDRNGTWDFTTVGSVHVTDNVAQGPTPSWYHLAFAGTASAPARCTGNDGQQTNVRAILSWAWVPPNCFSTPYWGNRIDFTARRDP
jgi:hypothetical protein